MSECKECDWNKLADLLRQRLRLQYGVRLSEKTNTGIIDELVSLHDEYCGITAIKDRDRYKKLCDEMAFWLEQYKKDIKFLKGTDNTCFFKVSAVLTRYRQEGK